ncbi:MAG: hypothetical protein AAF629_09230, partial [Chloroflexota bacterium]
EKFLDVNDFTYPKMEFMDQWTSFSWTDGFPLNNVAGHNVNSPWEQMLAWTGIVYWGQATHRPEMYDLGVYLYTTGLYNLEVYRYNMPQSYVPESATSDKSVRGDYLMRAMNDFMDEFTLVVPSGPYKGAWNPLAYAKQAFTGKTMWDTTISDSKDGAITTNRDQAYQYSKGKDHRTSHATYVYQGGVYPENTYWNSVLGMLSTSIYPQGPFSLALSRNRAYMADWLNSIHFQNGKGYFQMPYPTSINLLAGLLGVSMTVEEKYYQKDYYYDGSDWSPELIVPVPVDKGDFGYAPHPGNHPKNPQENAFVYANVNDNVSPLDWYWALCTAINQYKTDDDKAQPPWKNNTTGKTISMYAPADKNEGEILQYLYNYETYGTPDFTTFAFAVAAWSDGSTNMTPLPPMTVAWKTNITKLDSKPTKPEGEERSTQPESDVSEPAGKPTKPKGKQPEPETNIMIYHTNEKDIVVTFYAKDGETVVHTAKTVAPYTLVVEKVTSTSGNES